MSKAKNNVISAHRILEYLPALLLCALAWSVLTLGIIDCSTPNETLSDFVQNIAIGLCYFMPSSLIAGIFTVLVLVISIPISYRSWSRWSRYHLSRNHPIINTLVSLLAILSDYAACLLLIFGATFLGTDRYITAALLISLSLGLLIYSEIVSNDKFTLANVWKDADIYSLILITGALWGCFTALSQEL